MNTGEYCCPVCCIILDLTHGCSLFCTAGSQPAPGGAGSPGCHHPQTDWPHPGGWPKWFTGRSARSKSAGMYLNPPSYPLMIQKREDESVNFHLLEHLAVHLRTGNVWTTSLFNSSHLSPCKKIVILSYTCSFEVLNKLMLLDLRNSKCDKIIWRTWVSDHMAQPLSAHMIWRRLSNLFRYGFENEWKSAEILSGTVYSTVVPLL